MKPEITEIQETEKSIAELFVMEKYRRKGIGKSATVQIFDKFPGKWEVIREYTAGNSQQEKTKTEWWEGQAFIL